MLRRRAFMHAHACSMRAARVPALAPSMLHASASLSFSTHRWSFARVLHLHEHPYVLSCCPWSFFLQCLPSFMACSLNLRLYIMPALVSMGLHVQCSPPYGAYGVPRWFGQRVGTVAVSDGVDVSAWLLCILPYCTLATRLLHAVTCVCVRLMCVRGRV